MGLFDLFKRKPNPPANEEGPSADYVFAHYALRQVALTEPVQFLAIAASPDAKRFFSMLLEDVVERCGSKTTYDVSELKIHPTRVKSFPCAVIEFPEPKEMTEAFMVALVLMIETVEVPDADEIEARYFTLEKGFSMSGEPRTVLAEWDLETHSNYGDGPPANVEDFLEALEEHV